MEMRGRLHLSRPLVAVIALAMILVVAPRIEAGPVITSPKLDAKIGAGAYYIRWMADEDAKSYVLRIREKDSTSYWINRTLWTTMFAFRPMSHDGRGRQFEVFVYSCTDSKGTVCGEPSTVSAYVYGAPVVLVHPEDDSKDIASRQPVFTWRDYEGLHPSSGGGTLNYTITFSSDGASVQTFTTQSSTFTPPEVINPEFENPILWSVTACKSDNCSSESEARKISLPGSSIEQTDATN